MKSKIIIGLVILLSFSLHPSHIKADLEVNPIPLTNKEYAQKMVIDRWGISEWDDFQNLVQRESKWIPTAQNPNSTAYGLGQFLNSTWKTVGCTKTNEPYTQLECTADYIADRYDTPTKALQFQIKNNWY